MDTVKGNDGQLRELALFAGAGGGILGGHLLGWRTVCAVEIEPYAAGVLVARQNDGILPPFPIWDDVRTFDGRPWRGAVDVVCGGFPCQDISAAGNGDGIDGERSGLWREMARIVGEVRPRYVFVENSPLLVGRGLAIVLGDLAEMGFDAEWFCLSAANCRAPHQRDRIWLVAHAELHRVPVRRRTSDAGKEGIQPCRVFGDVRPGLPEQTTEALSDPNRQPSEGLGAESQPGGLRRPTGLHDRAIRLQDWPADPAEAPESGVGRVADGVAARVHRLKALGNGQVPRVAATAFALLKK